MIVIQELFVEPKLQFEDGQTVWRALNLYRNAAPIKGGSKGSKKKQTDFADALTYEKSKFLSK